MKLKRLPNVLTGLIVAVAAMLVMGVSASMLSNLRHAFGRRHRHDAPSSDAERDRTRQALALAPVLVDLDPKIWGESLQPLPQDFDFDAFRSSMPILDPPLSQTIIDERESSPY